MKRNIRWKSAFRRVMIMSAVLPFVCRHLLLHPNVVRLSSGFIVVVRRQSYLNSYYSVGFTATGPSSQRPRRGGGASSLGSQRASINKSNNKITGFGTAATADAPPPPSRNVFKDSWIRGVQDPYVANLLWDLSSPDNVIHNREGSGGPYSQYSYSTFHAALELCYQKSVDPQLSCRVLDAMVARHPSAPGIPTDRDYELVIMTICQSSDSSSLLPEALLLAESASATLPLSAYSALLSRVLRADDWKAAVRLLRTIESRAAVSSVVPSASSQRDRNSDLVEMYQRVIEACVRAGEVEPAHQTLLSCLEKGLTPSAYAHELVITSLSKRLQWRRALQLLERIRDANQLPTLTSFNSILRAMSKAREAGAALNLFSMMKQQYPTIQPNIYTYNNVLAAAAGNSRYSKVALQVLDQCQREPGVTPDVYTYSNAIRACAKTGQTSRALTLLQVVKDKGLPVDAYCYTAAMEACSKARMWDKALALMNEMQDEFNLKPSAVAYSLCISACGNAGKWQTALDLLQGMRDEGLRPNLITYNSAITALSRSAGRRNSQSQEATLWPRVRQLLQQMRDDGLEPDGFSYSAAISCCGAEGQWEEALGLIAEMRAGGTRPNKVAYSAAISCCGKNGQVDIALRLFQEMRDQGIVPDRVAYNAVFSALRVGKKSDAAYELWRSMLGQGQHAYDPVGKVGKRVSALADATPDIITVTEVIASISVDESATSRDRVDEVFREAFDRELVLRSNLDSTWDFDLSGLPLPVARAACRFIVGRFVLTQDLDVNDLTLITGVGVNHGRRLSGNSDENSDLTSAVRDISLRDFVQRVLISDFDPPLSSEIPARAQGTLLIPGAVLRAYLESAPASRSRAG